jgi:hypothetical protein
MCCGRSRKNFIGSPSPASIVTRRAPGEVILQYVGRTALTVMGPVTGACYRFERPGAQLPVDPRDGQAMVAVPVLRMM